MPHEKIRKSIDELRGELERTPKETSGLETKLAAAQDSIEGYTPEAVQDLVHFLQEEIKEFEVEHPRITALMNQVMTALSNLGI